MATHQEIANVSDQALVDRMVNSHDGRFDQVFWDFFSSTIQLPEQVIIADIGCGPGLLLRDLSRRYPVATLLGFDITQAMLDYAQNEVLYKGNIPTYRLHDINQTSLPVEPRSLDLITMVATLHVLPDPLLVLNKLRANLKPSGYFLLHDWIANPLPTYLARMLADVPADKYETAKSQMMKLFPSHNKFTIDDWVWLLNEANFNIKIHDQLGSPHFHTFICSPAADD